MDFFYNLISQYGNFALAALLAAGIVGLPVPDETLLAFAGVLAFRGKLDLLGVLAAGFLGAASGITMSFLLGRTAGREVVTRYGKPLRLSAERLARAEAWFERDGLWVLFAGYFVPGVRHFTALVAGATGLPWRRFALGAYAGAAVWSAAFILLGYWAGPSWRIVWQTAREERLLLLAGAIFVGALAWIRLRRRQQHNGSSPSAKLTNP